MRSSRKLQEVIPMDALEDRARGARRKLAGLTRVFVVCASAFMLELAVPKAVAGNPRSVSPPAGSVESQASDETKVSLPTITVWKVGVSEVPDTTAPPDLEGTAEKLGYHLRIQAFPAEGFTEMVCDAFADNQEPDILVIDNFRVMAGLWPPHLGDARPDNTAAIRQALRKVTESLKSLEGPRRGGWEFLFRTSRNHEAAKSLALQFDGCEKSVPGSQLVGDVRTAVDRIAHAYLEGPESSAKFNDADRLQAEIVNPDPETERVPGRSEPRGYSLRGGPLGSGLSRGTSSDLLRVGVREMTTCGCWGNDHLAFARVLSTYESKLSLGRLTVLLVLRNHEGEWRLLSASTDPVSKWDLPRQVPKLASLFQKPWTPDGNPAPARLLAPLDGKAPVPTLGERFGNFEWQPSESGNVVAEIVEFAYNDDARLFLRFTQANPPSSEQISAGMLWSGQEILWRWRVWSISDAGAVSFSESRAFPN
jgi:hypothetical protein